MIDNEQLRRDLASAAAHVVADSGLADRVTRSARRRHRRRLTFAAGVIVLVVLTVASGAVTRWYGSGTVADAVDQRLTQPTRGDLAGDRDFLASTTRAWEDDVRGSTTGIAGGLTDRQAPHVYWAGTTPAGQVAIVLQRARTPDQGWWTVVGLVGTHAADGRFTVLGIELQSSTVVGTGAFLFGPDDRTLIVMERDAAPYLSTGSVAGTAGKPSRSWQALPTDDGVSVLQLPDGTSSAGVLVTFGGPDPAAGGSPGFPVIASHHRQIADTGTLDERLPDRRLAWVGDVRPMRVGAQSATPSDIDVTFMEALEQAGAADRLARTNLHSFWYVLAGLPDGRTAIVGELQQDANPSQLWMVVSAADGAVRSVLWGGQVDPDAALPVAVRMPDAQGWVVAAYGSTLRYRTTPDGPWIDAGRDAALLPDPAVQVEVTAVGDAPVTVTL